MYELCGKTFLSDENPPNFLFYKQLAEFYSLSLHGLIFRITGNSGFKKNYFIFGKEIENPGEI